MSTTRANSPGPVQRLYWMKRWIYRTGGPGVIARTLNKIAAIWYSAGILSPARAVTLEVTGRRTGRQVSFPVVIADYDGEQYLVSMLGNDANWVRNVRAAGGRAVVRRGRREQVRLQEVEPAARAPILRRYLAVAPGARPHLPAGRHAPLAEFEQIASQFPVFKITPAATTDGRMPGDIASPGQSTDGTRVPGTDLRCSRRSGTALHRRQYING